MYMDTVKKMVDSAIAKKDFLNRSYIKYLISAMFAGIYVGFGIMLTFSIGAPFVAAQSPAAKAIIGMSFGIALSLVIFAGAELFTGNTMVMVLGSIEKKVNIKDTIMVWILSYLGNLLGSLFLAYLTIYSGLLDQAPQSDYIISVAEAKMNAPALQLFLRGILCNMLVCLAIWSSARTKDDTSKLILVWWCLYGFVGAGFEHSVANMSALGMAMLLPHGSSLISLGGFVYNLVYVTAGNIVGGTFLVGILYWYVSKES